MTLGGLGVGRVDSFDVGVVVVFPSKEVLNEECSLSKIVAVTITAVNINIIVTPYQRYFFI